jgi:hypothetical protein
VLNSPAPGDHQAVRLGIRTISGNGTRCDIAAHRAISGQIIVRGRGLVCRLSGSRAPLHSKRDGHRRDFRRLEPDTTTPLFPLEAAGVRADFLPEEKKKKKRMRARSDSLRKALDWKVREMDIVILANSCVGGWKRMRTALERKSLAGSIVREKSHTPSAVFPGSGAPRTAAVPPPCCTRSSFIASLSLDRAFSPCLTPPAPSPASFPRRRCGRQCILDAL